MLSRVAESIYWLSRYVERAENVARLIDVNLNLILDSPTPPGAEPWRPLVMITGDNVPFKQRYDSYTQENVIEFLTFDRRNPNSIISALLRARENARTVREVISSEMWEQVNLFYLAVVDPLARKRMISEPPAFFEQIKNAAHMLTGVTDATMSRTEGWHFGRMGRLLERADKTSRILDVKYFVLLPAVEDVGTPLDDIQWAALLRSASGFEMYRKRFGRITPAKVVEFLVLDRQFPRAILHCLDLARQSLHAISGSSILTFRNPAEQLLGRLYNHLAYAGVDDIFSHGLHEYLDNFQRRLNLVGDAIFDTFFALRPVADGVVYR